MASTCYQLVFIVRETDGCVCQRLAEFITGDLLRIDQSASSFKVKNSYRADSVTDYASRVQVRDCVCELRRHDIVETTYH